MQEGGAQMEGIRESYHPPPPVLSGVFCAYRGVFPGGLEICHDSWWDSRPSKLVSSEGH